MEKKQVIKTFINVSSQVSEVAKPLESLSVTCFSYLKNYNNNVQINLSSQPQWIDDYYRLELHKSSEFEGSPKEYDQQYSLWSTDYMDSPVIRHGRDNFNSDYGITLIEKNGDATEFYFFSGAADNPHMHNILINNTEYLKRFILYFKDKMGNQLQALERDKLFLPKTLEKNNTRLINIIRDDIALKSNRLYLSTREKCVRFSPRETECIRQLLEFKSTSQIATGMSVTIRTVECFIEQIKQKLNVFSKQELLAELIKLRA